jgi:hypothetical protein
VLELFEVVRKRGSSDIQFGLDVAHDEPLRMRDQQKLHDPESGLGTHRRKHIGKASDALEVLLRVSGIPGSRPGSTFSRLDVGIRTDLKRVSLHFNDSTTTLLTQFYDSNIIESSGLCVSAAG